MRKTVNLKRQDAQRLYGALKLAKNNMEGASLDFSFAVNLTIRNLEPEMLSIDEAIKGFLSARQIVIDKHARKDEDGTPINNNGTYQIEDAKAFSKEVEALEGYEEHVSFMEDEVECRLVVIPLDKADSKFAPIMEALMPIFEEYYEDDE